jgi:uncharacterized delta-60 repeat protein
LSNVYVTGSSDRSTDSDYATVKYDPNGNQLWAARYNGSGNSDDSASAMAVDSSGNIYVTGWSRGSGTNFDYATIKYCPDGNQLWVARYDGPGNNSDHAYAIAVDGSGNVYVTGSSYGSGTSPDYATIKYAPDGNQLWVARYNGPENMDDQALDLTIDNSGNIYITGWSSFNGQYNYDYTTIKYASDGNQLWVARYNGSGNGADFARALTVDSSGNIYVTGASYSGTSDDYATIKYTQHGICLGAVANDLNNDCKVDFEDFAMMASSWLECNYALEEDCW